MKVNHIEDKAKFFIVDSVTKERVHSTFTQKGIEAIIFSESYEVLDKLRNSEGGFDYLIYSRNNNTKV